MHFAPYGTIPGYVAMVKYFVEQAEAEFNKSKPNFNFLGMGSSKLAAAEKHAARQIIGYSNELKMMLINSKHPGWAMMGHS